MGLKTENYVSKSTNMFLPEAYAKLSNLIIDKRNICEAVFLVQSTRDNVDKFAAIEEVYICFKWDRQSNPVAMAYEKARTQIITRKEYDKNLQQDVIITEKGKLYGWQDDIIKEVAHERLF